MESDFLWDRVTKPAVAEQERALGSDHRDMLRTRSNIAYWIGQTGDTRESLRLFWELLPDQERALGSDHPDTLTTRSNIVGVEQKIDSPHARPIP